MSFGVIVKTRISPPPQGASAIETDTLFLAGQAASGTLTSLTECRTLDDFSAEYGPRVGTTVPSYDAADAFFREGGHRLFFGAYAADYGDALTLMNDPRKGPGQLAIVGPGNTGAATQFIDMQTSCQANNRVALRDVANGATTAAMETTGANAPAADDRGATFGPWVEIPPPAGVSGAVPRQVPASVIIAALCARVDDLRNPNRAAAGSDFPLKYANGLVTPAPSDVDRQALFAAGVNAFDDVYGTLENYGFQTNITQDPNNPYWQFNVSRGRMYLQARSAVRGQQYMFKPIDGRGRLAGALQGDLEDECMQLWSRDGLYGDTPAEAYAVNVSESVNTPTTIAQGELIAAASVVWTLHAKAVEIDLVTVPIGNPVTV